MGLAYTVKKDDRYYVSGYGFTARELESASYFSNKSIAECLARSKHGWLVEVEINFKLAEKQ